MTTDPMQCQRCGEPHAGCSAHTRAGLPCGNAPMSGQEVCRMHGGSAPQVREAAERRRQEAAAEEIRSRLLWNPGAVPVSDPIGELQLLAGQMRQAVDLLGAMLGPGEPCGSCGRAPMPLDSPAGVAWLKQQRELRGVLEAMGRLGIASRAVEVQQAQADLVLAALRVGLEALPSLSSGDRNAVLGAFLGELRRHQAGAGPVVAGEVTA